MPDYKLDKLVGRDPLPGDEVAFERVTRLFARARQVAVPAVKETRPHQAPPTTNEEKPVVIRLSKFVGRDQLPGDEVAFNRINALFDRARKVQPSPPKTAGKIRKQSVPEGSATKFRLDKLVGRDPLPGDEVAFDRVTRLFARARRTKSASKRAVTSESVGNKNTGGRKAKSK